MLNLLNPLWKYLCASLGISSLVLGIVVFGQARIIHHWHTQFDSEHAARLADHRVYAAAQEQAAAVALKQKQDTEARYAALATEKDQEYEIGLKNGRDAALRYIAAHRLWPSAPSPSGGPAAPAKDNGAIVPAKLPADPVVVSASDVQACTTATAYAIAAHNWALSLTRTTKETDR